MIAVECNANWRNNANATGDQTNKLFYSKPKSRFHTLEISLAICSQRLNSHCIPFAWADCSLFNLHLSWYDSCWRGQKSSVRQICFTSLRLCSPRSPEKSADFSWGTLLLRSAFEGFRLISGYLEKSASSSSTVLLFVNLKQKKDVSSSRNHLMQVDGGKESETAKSDLNNHQVYRDRSFHSTSCVPFYVLGI